MNIALIGYGKMGKAIEEVAIAEGHKIVLKINDENLSDFTKENLKSAEVAIEFTGPESALQNILFCLEANVAVVSGSTGWLQQLDKAKQKCKEVNGAFLYASNFSIGVNIFFELNKKLALLMKKQPGYNVSIEETHHTEKKDAPSGTAITLAEEIINISLQKDTWITGTATNNNSLGITSKRIDPAAGTHLVKYISPVDDIEIIHTAHNRKGFAAGALLAAEFIHNKKGIFSMKDVLGL